MGDVYGTAFKLLTLGFSVIPSGGGDKHKAPLVNWRDYQTTAPDESQLQAWECELNPVLWGIVANDRVAVIDADTPDTRAALEAELGEPHVVTPRGGAHWYIDTALRNVPHEVPPDIRLSLSTVCKLFTRVILLPTKLILHMVIDREV